MPAPKGNQNAKGNAGGRPTKYRPEHLPVARALTKLGGMDANIAEAIGVSIGTIFNWRAQYPEFAAACEPSDEDMLRAMKRSLYHRGMGYSHEAEKIMTVSLGGTLGSEVVREKYVEHYPPDVAAIRLFLLNKSAGEFVERQEVETSGDVTVRIEGGLPEKET